MDNLATLNVTHNGLSHDLPSKLDADTSDHDIRRIAAESLGLDPETFEFFVVDRFDTPQGEKRIYLRPKVPFGAEPEQVGTVLVFREGVCKEEVEHRLKELRDILDETYWVGGKPPINSFNPQWGGPVWYVP